MFNGARAKRLSIERQSGAVLVVGLIIMLLMTIVGLAAIRGSNMQEMMAGNMRDRNLAFQAAEAGLRIAEHRLETNSNLVFNNTNGLYIDLNQPREPAVEGESAILLALPVNWSAAEWESKSILTTVELAGTATAPRYIIEQMTTIPAESGSTGGCIEFGCGSSEPPQTFARITSRGTGGTNTTEVILQSTYRH